MHLVLGSLSIVKRRLQTLPLTVLCIKGELLSSIGCFIWLLFALSPPSSIAIFTQYLPILRCIQQIFTYISGLLASVTVAALYQRSAGSLLSIIVAFIFPVLSLPLIGVVLSSLYAQVHCLFSKASLLIYVLVLSIYPSLLGVFVLQLLFTLLLCLYRC